jgi:sterol desaturase/sphingolipid hydroxylase (fatty acid hydroxylase superfamily)
MIVIMFAVAPAEMMAETSGRGAMVESIERVGPDYVAEIALDARNFIVARVPDEIRVWLRQLIANPMLYLFIPFVLLLEWLFPCEARQHLAARAYLQDIVWFVATALTRVVIIGTAAVWLAGLYEDHLSFLTVDSATSWPWPVQIAVAVLLSEFVVWLHHIARHKIRALWVFHAVHHSQKRMNLFTDDRQHAVDMLTQIVLSFIPLLMFQVNLLHAVAIVGLYMSMHTRIIHANLKMDFGWLGYILTSPQFHRIHHSSEPAHQDKNFGGIVSLFDYVFGTAHLSRDSYPETGIEDAAFPGEDKCPVWQLPWNWVRQTAYPFGQLLQLRATSVGTIPETLAPDVTHASGLDTWQKVAAGRIERAQAQLGK